MSYIAEDIYIHKETGELYVRCLHNPFPWMDEWIFIVDEENNRQTIVIVSPERIEKDFDYVGEV